MSGLAEAQAGYAELLGKADPQEKLALFQQFARRDLFFLMTEVLDRDDMEREWLFARCREVQASPNGHLDLWAREHYKSTIITLGLTIQDILNDPEVTVGIFSHTRPIAKGFLRQIKREFEGNEKLRHLFPDILWENPRKSAPKWSEDDGIVVRRKGNPKEATVEAWGLVDGQPVGKHFRRVIYDDVVTPASVSTPEMIRKTTEAWELSLALGTDGGARRYIGTRYHFNDTYRAILERSAAQERRYPATEDGTVDGEPVLWGREALAERRRDMGPYTFGCQMLLDPKADATQGFMEEWLRFWPAKDTKGLNTYILVDPANEKKKRSDYTAMFVVGLGADKNYYVLAMVRDRMNLTERTNMLFHLHETFEPLAVGYEQYGMQADIDFIKLKQKDENYRFSIVELGGQVAKNDRIRRLIPLFEQGRMYLPDICWRVNYEGVNQDLTKTFIQDEYRAFPVGEHDDMLDCLSRIADPGFNVRFPRKGGGHALPPEAVSDYDALRHGS